MVPGDNTQVVLAEGAMNVADEPRVLLIIRDMTNAQYQNSKITLNLPASTTGRQLLEDVASKCHYDIETFELVLQGIVGQDAVVVNDMPTATLYTIGFRVGGNARNNLIIGDKNGEPPKRTKVVEECSVGLDDLQLGASASPVGLSHGMDGTYDAAPPLPPPLPSTASDYSHLSDYNHSHNSTYIKQETGYVGLVNQAMTCYLNSLLQTLFMTPEFRNALYRWEFDGTEAEDVKSIPYQLQKLFLLLQTSKKHAIETTELTKSFGWDSSEAWQQHDVQELCRVMFDALEQKFRNTDQADLINQLYQGKLKDYVKCQECGYESAREDTYLDIPLPVKPFGSSQAFGSVEEALQAFVQPEVLDGTNQYFCERCSKKCDAHKGLKFTMFPYLLTLQLKRFDFDYSTMHRIKLNDKVTFPESLNLNSFIKTDQELTLENNDDASTTGSGSALDDDTSSGQGPNLTNVTLATDSQDDDEGIDVESGNCVLQNSHEVSANEKNLRQSMEKGPYVYELFSIMVHSGSANGGHYYAYIKSFNDGHWYCFNDQSVTRITYDDIRKTYGGGPARSYYSGMYSSSTNAYMLMYRQIDKDRNAEAMTVEDFPKHIKFLLDSMEQQEEKERQQREMERNMCKIKLFWHHPLLKRMTEGRLKLHKDTTLAEATQTARMVANMESVPLNCCRLVKYDDTHDSLEHSFEDSEDTPIGELIGGAKSSYKFSLLFEVRPTDTPFHVYKPGGTTVKLFVVNLETEEIEGPFTVRAYLNQTVEEFKLLIVQTLSLPSNDMQVVLERYYNDLRPLTNPSKTLKSEGFYRSNKVFVAVGNALNEDTADSQAIFHRILDRYEYTICLRVALPEVDPETRNRLSYTSLIANGQNGKKSPGLVNTESQQLSAEYGLCPSKSDRRSTHPSPEGDDSSSREYDEGIGDSECDGHQQQSGGHGVHSDQSEDSSLTDSDRTIIGDSSPPNHSAGLEQVPKFSENVTSSDSNSPQESCEGDRNLSSPEDEATKEFRAYVQMNDWSEAGGAQERRKEEKRYFKAIPYKDIVTDSKMLKVYVDKRIMLGAFKKELESYVGVPVDYFKIYRMYPINQEFECTNLSENLTTYVDDNQIIIKLGRAPKKGEYRVKIYQLQVNEAESFKFLMDWIFGKGMTVQDAKKEIIPELKSKYGLDVPLNRCRLRKKTWRTPATIYLDHQTFIKDIPIFDNWEVYLEILSEPERLHSNTQLSLYAKKFNPSKLSLDPMEEIVLDDSNVEQLKAKLSGLSGIPAEHIDFAKGPGSFPCEISLLNVQTELEWNPNVTTLNEWPMYICDDGFVIYYKDSREDTKQISEDERREIVNKENARMQKIGRTGYSPRKERALKIYTDSSPQTQLTSTNLELQ